MNFLTRISPSFLKTREVSVSDDRLRILNMLAGGKITADEADRLLTALERRGAGEASPAHVSATGAKLVAHHDQRGVQRGTDFVHGPKHELHQFVAVDLDGLLDCTHDAS